MNAAHQKAAGGDPAASDNDPQAHSTSLRGRRAIVHLWTASRAVQGASLTDDDMALIAEALAEIQAVLS